MITKTPEAAVIASSTAVAATGLPYDSVISLALGLLGVLLARLVFVDTQNRRLHRRQTFRETGPLTGVAMLIAGTIIWDRHVGFSLAALIGLGTGWTAILLLDVLGKRLLDMINVLMGATPNAIPPRPERPDMRKQLRDAFPVSGAGERDLAQLLDKLPDEDA